MIELRWAHILTAKYVLVTKHKALTPSGYYEVVMMAEFKYQVEIFARNTYGKYWRRQYEITTVSDITN